MKILASLLVFVFFFSLSFEAKALDKRGYLPYHIGTYENDIEISSDYLLQKDERFLVVCDAPGKDQLPMYSRITTDSLTIFPAMLWNTVFYCHISVIDTSRKGRILKSSGSVKVKTPSYYLP